MQSLAKRPNTSQSQNFQPGQLAGLISPKKGFKTRIIYKNAPVEENPNEKRSLYGLSYNKSPQSRQGQRDGSDYGATQGQQVTLADIGGMKRSATDRNNLAKAGKLVDFQSPKSRGSDRSQQSQLSDRKGYKLEKKDSLEVKQKGKVVEISRHKNKGAEDVTETIRHPQERAKSVAASGEYYGCGCPVHVGSQTAASDAFKETMKSEFGNNPNINIEKDADYFETVRRLDICGNCWAQQKKYSPNAFKMNHKGPGLSIYKKDYVKHPLNDQGPILKNDFYSTFQNSFPLDATTTMRNDYKPWKVGPVKKETMDWRPATSGIPFAGNSNYRSDYVNWGPNLIIPEKAPHQKTTIAELPFNARTTYGDNFAMPDATNQLKPNDRDLWGSKKGSPFTSGIPFLGQTTHGSTFKPFKVDKVPCFQPEQEYEPTQALPEHMKSLYKRDFGAPNPWVCPAVVFMQHHPHPRFKYLSEKDV